MHGGDRVCAIYAKKLMELGHVVNVIAPKKKLLSFKEQIKLLIKEKTWLSESKQRQNHFELLNIDVNYLDDYAPVKSDDIPDADVIIATWWATAEWIKNFPLNKGKKAYFIQHLETHSWLPVERVHETYRMPYHQITIAKWLVDEIQTNYAGKNISLVPNSVDHDSFFAPKRAKQTVPTLGFLFSESTFKGVPVALEVIEKIKKESPLLRVICFGNSQPKTINLPDYIEFILNPFQDEIRGIYEQCDVWLCCSLSEGFGLTLLEAMACRVPVVSTKCGGPEDIVSDGKNGYLCDVNDVKSLANSTTDILNFDEYKWLQFSENARMHAMSYTWNDAAKLFEKALVSTVERSHVL